MMTKPEQVPRRSGSLYINVPELDAAVECVNANGTWIVQGAMFALVAPRR